MKRVQLSMTLNFIAIPIRTVATHPTSQVFMSVKPVTVNRISDAVCQALESRILDGTFKPGRRLPSERKLALELGVSRTSLREAIQQLASKGLLTTRHGGGTYVTDSLEAPFVDPWQVMLNDHPMLQVDILEFRHMLEGKAAALAAERATAADIKRLDNAFAALELAYQGDDMPHIIRTDVCFHQAVADAAHNVLIGHLTASLLRVIHTHISRNLEHLFERPRRWEKLQEQHRAIWQAIRTQNPAAANEAARTHIDFVWQSMMESDREEERRQSAIRRLGEVVAQVQD